MDRNLRLYPRYRAARSLAFWLPIFFLYFSSRLRADQVLVLEAIYYAGVVVLEVPSGYFSDRLGRRPTLIIAAVCQFLGCVALGVAPSFEVFVVGQLLLAAWMAFNSGTDGALLFGTLEACERGDELAEHEARAQSHGLLAMAFAAVVGGLAGTIDLRLGHLLSAVAGLITIGLALSFREPAATGISARSPMRQLGAVVAAMRQPALAWVFVFAVSMTVFNHVPYELAQPYLAAVLGDAGAAASTPWVCGVLVAVMMIVAAGASRVGARLATRTGPATVLLGAMAVQGIVIGAMGQWLHPIVLVVLLLRSVPGALAAPVMLSVVLPALDSGLRATYLSVQSLAGRLAFSAALLVASSVVGGFATLSHPAMATLCFGFGAALVGVALVLLLGARALARPARSPTG